MTIPKPLRDRFNLTPSSEVQFVEEKGQLIVKKVSEHSSEADRRRRIQGMVGILDGVPEDVDEAIEEMRGR